MTAPSRSATHVRHWTHEDKQTLRRLYAEGRSDTMIAAALGRTMKAVKWQREEAGLVRRRNPQAAMKAQRAETAAAREATPPVEPPVGIPFVSPSGLVAVRNKHGISLIHIPSLHA